MKRKRPHVSAKMKKQWRSYSDANGFVIALELKSQTEWKLWASGELKGFSARPSDIPSNPQKIYRNNGWTSMGAWLGTGRIAPQFQKYLDFNRARDWVHTLQLKGEDDWRKFLKGAFPKLPKKPDGIPASPNYVYKKSGWLGWGDWLGTGNTFTHEMQYWSFFEARDFVRKLGLRSRAEWEKYCGNNFDGKEAKPDSIPKTPWVVYKGKGWINLSDWLGTSL